MGRNITNVLPWRGLSGCDSQEASPLKTDELIAVHETNVGPKSRKFYVAKGTV